MANHRQNKCSIWSVSRDSVNKSGWPQEDFKFYLLHPGSVISSKATPSLIGWNFHDPFDIFSARSASIPPGYRYTPRML